MRAYRLTRLSDRALLGRLSALLTQDRVTTAELLAVIAEVERRRLYVPAGYSSMFAYCTEVLHLSEHVAYKRIALARAARKHPVLLTMLFLAGARLRHLAVLALLGLAAVPLAWGKIRGYQRARVTAVRAL